MTNLLVGIEHEWTPGTRKAYDELWTRYVESEPLHEARFKAAAWDAREAWLKGPGDDDKLYEGWENAEFNLRMHEKDTELSKLRAEVVRLRNYIGCDQGAPE